MLSREIKILLYGSNLWYLGEGMLGPLFAVFAEKVGGNVLDITWAWATYLIVTGFLMIIIGRISDKSVSKQKLMVLGYALNAAFTFAYLLVSSPAHLFFVQAGLGLASALSVPTWTSLYARFEDREHDGFTWGLAGGEAQLTTGLAIIIGGLIVTYGSFTTLFTLMGCIQIVAAVYTSQILGK